MARDRAKKALAAARNPGSVATHSLSPGGAAIDEVALAVAQGFWGRGNLTPLDALFGATAMVKLVPTKGFAFLGYQLGQRLRKYADDTGATVDAAEVEPVLTRQHAKQGSSIYPVAWKEGAAQLKPARYSAVALFQPGVLGMPLADSIGNCAQALKPGGKLFLADLMETQSGAAAGGPARLFGGEPMRFHCQEEHVRLLRASGLQIEDKIDLTANFLSSVRTGFIAAIPMLEAQCLSPDADSVEQGAAFVAQLEIWVRIYGLARAHKMEATGFLALRKT